MSYWTTTEYLEILKNKMDEQGNLCGGHPGGEPCTVELNLRNAVYHLNGVRPQLAHRIPNTKANRKRFGEDVINHPINLVAVCSLRCNSSVLAGAGRPLYQQAIVDAIEEARHGAEES